MLNKSKKWILGGTALMAVPALLLGYSQRVQSSDHGDTIFAAQTKPAADLTDLYVFPSATNANNVVLVMNTHGLITPAQVASTYFDPDVLYQFKIDTNADNKEDLVIQAKFGAPGPNQSVQISGPVKPSRVGVQSVQEPITATGKFNNEFPAGNMRVFAGPRSDSFFFDIEQLCVILPDRCQPFKAALGGNIPAPANPNQPMSATFRLPGAATDTLANLNVMSVVVEVPKAALGGGKIGVWMTTST